MKVDPQHVGVPAGHPGRMGGSRGGKADVDPILGQQIEDFIEPAKLVPLLFGLEQRPAKNRQRGDVDVG